MSGIVGFIGLDGELCVERARGLFWNSRRRAEGSEYAQITQVKFDKDVTVLADMAMAGIGATQVVLPDTITQIGGRVFKKSPNLQKVVLSSAIRQVKSGVCAECENLETVDLRNVTSIEDRCFEKCSKLQFVLPNNIHIIGERAFYGTANTELVLPRSLKTCGNYAFANMQNLQRLAIYSDVKLPREAFVGCKKLNEVWIGNQGYKVIFYDRTPLLRRGDSEVIHGVNVVPVSYIGDNQILYMAWTPVTKTRHADKKSAVQKVRVEHMYATGTKMLDGVTDLTARLNISFKELFCLKQTAAVHGDSMFLGMKSSRSAGAFDCDKCLKNMPEIYHECCRRYGLDKIK